MLKQGFLTLKRLIKVIATLIVGITLFASYLLFSTHGAELTLDFMAQLNGYTLKYQSFQGSIFRSVEFHNLDVKGKNLHIQGSYVKANWDLLQWIDAKRPTFEKVEATNLTVTYHGEKITSSLDSPLLGSSFLIQDLTLRKALFTIHQDTHPIDLLHLKQASNKSLESLEFVEYEGSLGKFKATLSSSIEAEWSLAFNDHPFFKKYHQGNLTTEGKIWLPKRKWRDPNNKIDIILKGNKALIQGQTLKDFQLKLIGTPANHRGELVGRFNQVPIKSTFQGKLTPNEWRGTLSQLNITHSLGQSLEDSTADLLVQWDNNIIRTELDILIAGLQSAKAQLSIHTDKQNRLQGKIEAQSENIRKLAPIFPQLKRVRGSATLQMAIQGKLSQPKLTGNLTLINSQFPLPALKSKANIDRLIFTLSDKQILTLAGYGTLGSGSFSLEGQGSIAKDNRKMNVRLTGEQLLLSDTPEYYIIGAPDLTLAIENGTLKLTGKVLVPHAEINSFKSHDAIQSSQDIVMRSPTVPVEETLPKHTFDGKLFTNVDIILGEKILYNGFGFKTKAKGQLNIRQSPGQPTKAKGKISLVDGQYRAYRKRFDIAEGELLFTGGMIDNPTLNIRAERKIKTSPSAKSFHAQNIITAGVKFSGPLKGASIDFYSSPAMSNADIISYLVIGKPQSKMDESQAELLFEAVSQLALLTGKKRNDVQFDLAEKLKLDQFGFSKKANAVSGTDRNPLEDVVFVMGKQLSDKLYLHYSVGLVDSSNNIGLKYFMNKNITVEASAGTEGTSADLLLTFEGH